MKKLLVLIALLTLFTTSVFAYDNPDANSRDESRWTTMTYTNIPILKILESSNGYAIIYQKNKVGTGSTVVPKAWGKGNVDNPRKMKIRIIDSSLKPFMTIVSDGGEFKRVILNVPKSKSDPVWGVVPYSKPLDVDKSDMSDVKL
ncbi:MAG: hypothetical protein MJ176_07920 [Treponema sp.]|nr:hypothetical protein [Treponema sp.]